MTQRYIHDTPHPLSGKTVLVISKDHLDGEKAVVEDYWDRVYGKSWMRSSGNPAAMSYSLRSVAKVPIDDEVLYVKIGGLGFLLHCSEVTEKLA